MENEDVCEAIANTIEKDIKIDEVVYSLCYEDVITVLGEVYGEKALKWNKAKLLKVVEDVKDLMCERVSWLDEAVDAVMFEDEELSGDIDL
jgi:hypothetical protein